MEHIVQFGVTIDDNAIADRIAQRVANEVKSDIKERVENIIGWDSHGLKDIMREEVKRQIDDNFDEILKQVIDIVSSNVMRKKAIREIIKGE